MAFEIELSDGTVLELEDGEDPDLAEKDYFRQQRVDALKAKNPAEYDPESEAFKKKNAPVEYIDAPFNTRGAGTGTAAGGSKRTMSMVDPSIENERAAIGSGMLRGWKGLTNLVLPDSLTPEWASDENIQEMDRRDEHLPASGKLIGSLAATGPLSGPTGTVLSTAAKAAPAASVLARTLASPFTRSAIEGATQGAIFADPDEQGKGAAIGGALGPAMTGLGKAGGRVLRGLVEKSDAAKALEQLAAQHGDEIFVPISQSASDEGLISPLVKGFYKEALPIVPTVKGQIEKQSAKGAEKLREIALKEALPTGGTLPANAGNKVGTAVADIKSQIDDAYDQTIKSYAFNVPKNLDQDLAAAIKAGADPKTMVNKTTTNRVIQEVKDLFEQFSDGKPHIDGQNLLNVKRMISKLIGEADNHEKGAFRSADKMIDDLIVSEMKQGNIPGNLADLKRYLELTPAYRAFTPVERAAEQAADKEGRFLFRTLARTADNSPEQRVLGQVGAATLDKPATGSSLVGKILGGVATGGAGIGAFMAPMVTAGIIGGGRTLASKGVQKTLLGDTKLQKLIVELLRNNPKAARRMGSAARAAVVQSAAGEIE